MPSSTARSKNGGETGNGTAGGTDGIDRGGRIDKERQKGSRMETRRKTERGREKVTVGGER